MQAAQKQASPKKSEAHHRHRTSPTSSGSHVMDADEFSRLKHHQEREKQKGLVQRYT